jgi:hypothetical protein
MSRRGAGKTDAIAVVNAACGVIGNTPDSRPTW